MLKTVHNKYFSVSSLKDLFVNIDNHHVIDFINETHFLSSYVMFVVSFLANRLSR